jgi:DNA-binding response OmpR family regulator
MPYRNLPILLVEGDDELRYSFLEHLQRHGFFGIGAASAEDAIKILTNRDIRMAIIDFDLSGGRGHQLADQLHVANPKIPIVGHLSDTDLDAQLAAYSYGIDDLWMKPIPLSLAVGKCRAMLRRTLTETLTDAPLQLGDVIIDLRRQIVMRDQKPLALNEKELGIIRTLAMEHGAPVRRETLMAHVWGFDSRSAVRTVDNYIVSLRRKIERDPSEPQYLLTVGGIGYRLKC